MKKLTLLIAVLMSVLVLPSLARAVDLKQIEKDLGSADGVVGWIHGAVPERNMYVFTYRNPEDFFDYVQISLIARDPALKTQLATFNHDDQVRIKGSRMDNPSPQMHVDLTSIELVKKFEGLKDVAPYKHEVKLPDDLLRVNEATFLVHAIAGEGQILVVEYKDQVLPIFIKNAKLTTDLRRGDVVRLKFSMQKHPNQPTHLVVNEDDANPLVVLESLAARHGQKVTVEGALVMFPKSPEIIFNVFAVEDESPSLKGYKRQFTIVNQEDPAVFKAIRTKLQNAWDAHGGQYVNGRNKLISTKLHVKVTGVFNDIDANQANAQVLIDSADKVVVTEDPMPTLQFPVR